MMQNVLIDIRDIIEKNDVVLFMKGTTNDPMCGFSQAVVQILNAYQVSFLDVDVLANEEIRQGIKTFSNWPTIPQLYVKQEFIGGCDIVRELYSSGELKLLLEKHNLIGVVDAKI